MLSRTLHLCDLGQGPSYSQLLSLMNDQRIPASFHKIIEQSAPGQSFQQIRAAIENGTTPTTHLYQDMVTNDETQEVTGVWEPSEYEMIAFTGGSEQTGTHFGLFSQADMAQLNAIFLPYLLKLQDKEPPDLLPEPDPDPNPLRGTPYQDLFSHPPDEGLRPVTNGSIGLGLSALPNFSDSDSESDLDDQMSIEMDMEPQPPPKTVIKVPMPRGRQTATPSTLGSTLASREATPSPPPASMEVTLAQFLPLSEPGLA